MTRTHRLLAATSLIAVALFLVTLRRVPSPFSDEQFYASISRELQLHGVGVPSVVRYSPVAVDHIPFYGPVFFTIVAHVFDWFGVSLAAVRLVSLAGALLTVAAAALLAQAMAGAKWRWLWAATLLLLTPEIRQYATVGTMATLAVGFEMMALAVFVYGLRADRRRVWYGIGSGALLGLAALTTPRTYLFIAAFFVAGVLCRYLSSGAPRGAWQQLAVTFGTLALTIGTWAVASHGSVANWVRYIGFILLHEDTDVAILPTASRQWLFSPANAAIPFVTTVCALVAAAMLSRRRASAPDGAETARIARFALLTGWIAFVAGIVTLNLTFTQTTHIGLPLFIIVLAIPYESIGVPRRALAVAVIAVLSLEGGLAGIWYARVAATWAARDPQPLYEFFDRYVPDGAAVIGSPAPYFMAVERSGARFRDVSPRSWADWARWVPVVEPQAVAMARNEPATATRGRYLIWGADGDLPDGYACAATHEVAVYQPAPTHLDLLGWIGARTWETGYPRSVLYLLPSGCPTGYDPTHY